MKTINILLILLLVITPVLSQAQTETDTSNTKTADTTTVKLGKTKIIIVEDKDDRRITDNNDPSDTTNVTTTRRKPEAHWAGFEIGINTFTNSQGEFDVPRGYEFLDLNESKSVAVNINFIDKELSLINNRLLLVTGLGMTFNNYRFRNNITLLADTNRVAATYDTINYQKSKLAITYLTVPLLLEFNDGRSKRSFHMAAGIIGGLRIGSHTKQKYQTGSKTVKPKVRDDFNLNPVKLDATARFGFGSLAIFGSYNLNGLFKDNRGPVIYPFTAGVGLTF